jgi:hypothetical protein
MCCECVANVLLTDGTDENGDCGPARSIGGNTRVLLHPRYPPAAARARALVGHHADQDRRLPWQRCRLPPPPCSMCARRSLRNIYIYIYIMYLYICIYVYMYIYIYVYMYICMCVCVYIYTLTHFNHIWIIFIQNIYIIIIIIVILSIILLEVKKK